MMIITIIMMIMMMIISNSNDDESHLVPLEAARDLLLRGVHGLVAHGAAARHLGAALDQLHGGLEL